MRRLVCTLALETMGVIATLIPNQSHVQRLRTALRDRHELVPCDDWDGVLAACENQPVRLAIVDLFVRGRPRQL